MQLTGEKYGHKDPSRARLASEKALSTHMWVLRPSFLTRNISCLASSARLVCLGLCGERQISLMLRNVYIMF